MAESTDKLKPWLIAAWPGMGNVAVIAASFLVENLDMKPHGELISRGHFDIAEIKVKDGLISPVHLPRGLFFHWANPSGGRDLYVFIGEAQPDSGAFTYADELIAAVEEFNVERVITFASMASALHPAGDPKVTGIATDSAALEELRRAEVRPMEDGQIGGLNGVVLAAARQHGMSGMCLLAEIPFFAANIPNPKAARAALSVFCILMGIEVSLDPLNKHAIAVERMLIEVLEKLQAQGVLPEEYGSDEAEEETNASQAPQPTEPHTPTEPALDYAARQRLEHLFELARRDQNKAMALKQELDRLGVFKQYEDRFLDLFRRAG